MIFFGDLIQEVERQVLNRDLLRPDVRRSINKAQRWVARKRPWRFLEAEFTTPATATAPNDYTLPKEVMAPLSIRLRKPDLTFTRTLVSRVVSQLDLTTPDQTKTNTTVPNVVTFSGNIARLTPVFTSSANHLIVLRAIQNPPKMTQDDDLSIFPDGFSDVLVDASIFEMTDWLWNDPAQAQIWERRALAGINEMRLFEMGDLDHQDQMMFESGMAALMENAGNAGDEGFGDS